MREALLARASAEELAAQACSTYYGHTYYSPNLNLLALALALTLTLVLTSTP